MRTLLVLAAWLAAVLTPAPVTAEAPAELACRPLGEDRGLDDVSVVADRLIDRRGFLCVGSREGLYRYDGYRSSRFFPDMDDPDAITDLDVRALYEDRDGESVQTGFPNGLRAKIGEGAFFVRERTGIKESDPLIKESDPLIWDQGV